jgi:hypothetical protein
MFFQRSTFIYKLISDNRLALFGYIPSSLQKVLNSAVSQRYQELYEPEANGNVLLEDTLEEILNSFGQNSKLLGQLRYVWMALTLAAIVEPTLIYYQPDNQIPEKTIDHLTCWLLETLEEIISPQKHSDSACKNIDSNISVDFQNLDPINEISSLQVLSEALDVYSNALKTIEPNQSLEALLNILDDCLEGYAIFPGSDGRRELFEWWLLDVVPSCWYLLPPASAYSLNDADKSSALIRLEGISSLLWSLIWAATENKKESRKNILSFYDNTSTVLSDEVGSQTENNQLLLSSSKNV